MEHIQPPKCTWLDLRTIAYNQAIADIAIADLAIANVINLLKPICDWKDEQTASGYSAIANRAIADIAVANINLPNFISTCNWTRLNYEH